MKVLKIDAQVVTVGDLLAYLDKKIDEALTVVHRTIYAEMKIEVLNGMKKGEIDGK